MGLHILVQAHSYQYVVQSGRSEHGPSRRATGGWNLTLLLPGYVPLNKLPHLSVYTVGARILPTS
jgi:hypothetical protein